MKKVDIIVEARLSSKRLPKKVMLKVLNRPLLDLMIERLKQINFVKSIIIATTTNKEDDAIEKIAIKNKVNYFRGSELDVLGRVTKAIIKNKTDIVVQITGDNPLADKNVVENLIKFFIKNYERYDFVSNDAGIYNSKFTQEYPMGLNTKVFKSSLLLKVEKLTSNPVDREHVVNYILKNCDKFKILSHKAPQELCRPELRFTLDYLEDFNLIKLVFENLYPKNSNFSILDVINFLDNNPKIKNINSNRKQQIYKY